MADVTMPQLGETVTEGTITKWFKQVGDKVDPDEVLFEVSTDKVDSEVPSPAGGFIAEILVPEGETVDVGTKLAVISDSPPAGGSAPAQEPAAAPATAPSRPAAAAPSAPAAPTAPAVERSPVDDEVVAFSNIRKRTAEHMVRSQATSAHVLTAVEVDFENVDRVRRAHREEFKQREGTSLTYLPFIARTVVDAIEEFPHLNPSGGDNRAIGHPPIPPRIPPDLSLRGTIR